MAVALVALVACGARHSTSEIELSEDCASYLTSYRACLGHMGSAAVADKRTDAVRESLLATAREEATREGADARCRSAKQDIDSACR